MDWIFFVGIPSFLLLFSVNFCLTQYNSVCSQWGGVCRQACTLQERAMASRIRSECPYRCCVPHRRRLTESSRVEDRSLISRNRTAQCGNNTLLTPRTSGPYVGSPTDWPWLVRIHSVSPAQGQGICAGALLDDVTVLTVAHCVDRFSVDRLRVVVGDFDLTVTDVGEEVINVDTVNISPGFVRGQRGSDLAVLKLSRPAQLSATKWPVCLPSQSNASPDANEARFQDGQCFLAGWLGSPDGKVRSSRVQMLDRSQCDESTQKTVGIRPLSLPDDIICTDTPLITTGTCQPDDGALLCCQDSNNRFVLEGLVTESSCGRLPTLYTSVESFMDAIRVRLGTA